MNWKNKVNLPTTDHNTLLTHGYVSPFDALGNQKKQSLKDIQEVQQGIEELVMAHKPGLFKNRTTL